MHLSKLKYNPEIKMPLKTTVEKENIMPKEREQFKESKLPKEQQPLKGKWPTKKPFRFCSQDEKEKRKEEKKKRKMEKRQQKKEEKERKKEEKKQEKGEKKQTEEKKQKEEKKQEKEKKQEREEKKQKKEKKQEREEKKQEKEEKKQKKEDKPKKESNKRNKVRNFEIKSLMSQDNPNRVMIINWLDLLKALEAKFVKKLIFEKRFKVSFTWTFSQQGSWATRVYSGGTRHVVWHPRAEHRLSLPNVEQRNNDLNSQQNNYQDSELTISNSVDQRDATTTAFFKREFPLTLYKFPGAWLRVLFSLDWQILGNNETALRKLYAHDKKLVNPSRNIWWEPLRHVEFKKIKVIILEHDPLKEVVFDERYDIPVTSKNNLGKSRNLLPKILAEVDRDHGLLPLSSRFKSLSSFSLKNWAKQGVLILDAYLTRTNCYTEELLWPEIVQHIIQKIANYRKRSLVIMAWGHKAGSIVDNLVTKAYILKCDHPNAEHGAGVPFKGCGHFKLCNKYLIKKRMKKIDWYQ